MTMEKHYRIAGVNVTVSMDSSLFYEDERYLAPFAAEQAEDAHVFHFVRAEELPPPEGTLATIQPYFRVYSREGRQERYAGPVKDTWETARVLTVSQGRHHRVYVRREEETIIGAKTVLDALCMEHLVARAGGFFFHCACVAGDGGAILFTAPSGTGKSTQAELWRSYRGHRIINGDRAAVTLREGALRAEGIPFCGSSAYCENESAPIRAIVYLSQAPVTSIRRLRGFEAFSRIWEGISVNTWDKTDMAMVSETVRLAAERIPVYHMPCTPDEEAVRILEDALRKQAML